MHLVRSEQSEHVEYVLEVRCVEVSADRYLCFACSKVVTATKNNRYRSHSGGDGEPCEMSSAEIPEHVLAQPVGADDAPDVPREGVDFSVCPQCTRKVKLTRLGYFEPHDTTLRGGDRCPVSGVRAKHARKLNDVPLPGDDKPKPGAAVPAVKDSTRPVANRGLAITSPAPTTPTADRPPHEVNLARDPMQPSAPGASSSASTGTSSPASSTTSTDSKQPAPSTGTSSDVPGEPEESASADSGPPVLHLAPLLGDGSILQPFSHISQPFPVPVKVKLKEAMTEGGRQVATRFKEIFFSYNNRRSSDNRGAQRTLGPSEIGHECDRRLAMSLMGVAPVNPGGDGWAAWIGTQGHRGLEEIFTWASAQSGRFVTEARVRFDSQYVPHGTADLFDRVVHEVGDFKFMGEYSLKKLIQDGPPEHYKVQLQMYGLGMERMGEKVRSVALYGLPRAGSSLDGMYVWTAPYDRKVALAALARVERIAKGIRGVEPRDQMKAASFFDVADECRYCPFHLKNDKEMKRGCPGK